MKKLKLEELILYSNKLYSYIKTKFDTAIEKIKDVDIKLDEAKTDLQEKIQVNTDNILDNTNKISNNETSIDNVSSKVDELQTKADNGDFDTQVNGNILNINNISQHRYKNIKAGDTIEIPNDGVGTDFLIQCYEQTSSGTPLLVREIEIIPANKDLFEYDERYVEITDSGAKPKDSVEIPLELNSIQDGLNIYISKDTIPIELIESIDNITNFEIKERDQ